MTTRLLMLAVFATGLSIGWLGNSWFAPDQSTSDTSIGADGENAANRNQNLPTSDRQFSKARIVRQNDATASTSNVQGINVQSSQPAPGYMSSSNSITDAFNNLLSDRQYPDAINLYQEQKKQNTQIAATLKANLINHLELLTRTQNNSDFSALINQYLSTYYDDVDILLLLADFNQANGSYLEVVDVYLLAKTYAYSEIDQQTVSNRFNNFVDQIDRSYTNQRNWWSLVNFYSHVNASGLMTSTHQYLQALAHLRSGDESFAIEQFNQLLTDSVVGDLAALALSNLDNHTNAPAIDSSSQEQSESITLQKVGNQFAVNLTNSRQDIVKLLIDTGASMTTISRTSFSSLGIDAIEQDRRMFRTAGGVVMGTVYSVPELNLGPYLLKNTQVAVLDFETAREIDGLLGMNILGQFRFQIDQENTQLHLSKK